MVGGYNDMSLKTDVVCPNVVRADVRQVETSSKSPSDFGSCSESGPGLTKDIMPDARRLAALPE